MRTLLYRQPGKSTSADRVFDSRRIDFTSDYFLGSAEKAPVSGISMSKQSRRNSGGKAEWHHKGMYLWRLSGKPLLHTDVSWSSQRCLSFQSCLSTEKERIRDQQLKNKVGANQMPLCF